MDEDITIYGWMEQSNSFLFFASPSPPLSLTCLVVTRLYLVPDQQWTKQRQPLQTNTTMHCRPAHPKPLNFTWLNWCWRSTTCTLVSPMPPCFIVIFGKVCPGRETKGNEWMLANVCFVCCRILLFFAPSCCCLIFLARLRLSPFKKTFLCPRLRTLKYVISAMLDG